MDANGTGLAERHAAVLEALADGTRRRVFELVADRAMSVGEVARYVPVSRPAVSQHLRVLKDAGLVQEERAGTRRMYSVAPGGDEPLRVYLDRLWTSALRGYEAAAAAAAPTGPTHKEEEHA